MSYQPALPGVSSGVFAQLVLKQQLIVSRFALSLKQLAPGQVDSPAYVSVRKIPRTVRDILARITN